MAAEREGVSGRLESTGAVAVKSGAGFAADPGEGESVTLAEADAVELARSKGADAVGGDDGLIGGEEPGAPLGGEGAGEREHGSERDHLPLEPDPPLGGEAAAIEEGGSRVGGGDQIAGGELLVGGERAMEREPLARCAKGLSRRLVSAAVGTRLYIGVPLERP